MSQQPQSVLDDKYPDEIIVALEHLDLVRSLLSGSGVSITSETPSHSLQLAKLALDYGDDQAQGLWELAQSEPGAAKYADRIKLDDGSVARDRVMQSLRLLSATRYGGWIPTLGKNRIISRPLTASAETGWGGVGDPTALDKEWPRPPARGGGPGQGVRVGVLDTAIYPQDWLAGGWVARFSDTVPEAASHLFSAGHATFLTGLILSQAPGATVEVRQVLDEDGTKDAWTVAEAIVDIGRSELDVLNLSFSCYTADGEPPLVLAAAIDRLDPDLVVVAAAGNHAVPENDSEKAKTFASLPAWPGALDDVLAVGALDEDGQPAPYSPNAPWVDIHARGVGVRSTYLASAGATLKKEKVVTFDGWAEWSGTSFSAALVTGAIAAGIDPGRVNARDALANILDKLREQASGAYGPGPSRQLTLRLW